MAATRIKGAPERKRKNIAAWETRLALRVRVAWSMIMVPSGKPLEVVVKPPPSCLRVAGELFRFITRPALDAAVLANGAVTLKHARVMLLPGRFMRPKAVVIFV